MVRVEFGVRSRVGLVLGDDGTCGGAVGLGG